MNPSLELMRNCLREGNQIYLPSKFWDALNKKNIEQLEQDGIENLKQTLAQNYFTWVIGRKDPQFRYLVKHMRLRDWPVVLDGILTQKTYGSLSKRRSRELTVFTRMLWKFAERIDTEGLLKRLDEPKIGNPFEIQMAGKLISQDMANSVLEYYSIQECIKHSPDSPTTICEIGAGYGRNAFIFLKSFPRCKYIIVDIPPALHVSEHYLSSVFNKKKIFSFRCFSDFSEVKEEFDNADIVFLLPHQAELLPPKQIDLCINISSLHEMTKEQISAYFKLINTQTKGYFYTKQWLIHRNAADNITITQDDYPIPQKWEKVFHRTAKVQTYFFEALYKI